MRRIKNTAVPTSPGPGRSRRPGESGSSLVEVIVAAGIASVATIFIAKMAILAFDSWSQGEGRIRLQERTSQGMGRMAREIRQADQTGLVAAGGSLTFRIPQDIDGDGTVIDVDGVTEYGSEITYSLDGGALLREQDQNGNDVIEDGVPGERSVLATGLSALYFQTASPGLQVTMSMEVQPLPSGASPQVETVTSYIRLNNRSEGS